MKTSKLVYSQCFDEYKLTDANVKKLQDVLLNIFVDVKNVCDENNITYMMAGGSLLGTIRHKGFIPWDDDIDLMMTRTEYEKFRTIFTDKLSDKYILADPSFSDNYFNKMPKIYKKNTNYVELSTMNVPTYDMIFIDIFIIENIPNSFLYKNYTLKK